MRWHLLLTTALACTSIAGCDSEAREEHAQEATFGVFFGGQLQRRHEVPFDLDATRQRLGFRLALKAPVGTNASLRWELSKPGARGRTKTADPRGRRTELGRTKLAPGTIHFDQPLALLPGDAVGLWNLRVTLEDGPDERALLDQPFWVYDARERSRKQAKSPASE